MSQAPSPRERDRRGFLKMVAAAATLLPAAAHAQAPTPTAQPAPAPAPATPTPPPGPEHSTGEARMLTEVLRARYPDRFNETQWASVASDFDGDLAGGKRLRATKLANGDEPDVTFRA